MLEVRGVDVFYGDVQVLNGPDLSVEQGEIVALLGSNGAGKTTMIRTITGLLRPRRGTIIFDGKRIDRLRTHAIVDLGIALVPEGRQIFPQMTIEENLLLGSYLRRTWAGRSKNLEGAYSMFPRLAERRTQEAATLSGGEQQMLAIGRALMSEPRMLILDEPSLGLAPFLVKEVFRTIAGIRQRGVTVFLVEQNVQQSLKLADRAYVLEAGAVVLKGTGEDLLGDAEVRKAYLAV